ncbi:MAG TPA: hypothetical protein VH394_09520 [Thermoanaerobaculia bacterium]|jgi:hypothetical protein|nr:hypothetical protein [Thermoanaerobaculia bacterium]
MRVPKAFLFLVLTISTPIWAQPGMAVPSRMLADQMVSARLAELERVQSSILSEPWSAETASRLQALEGILKTFNAPGHERQVSLLLSRCNRAYQMARLDRRDDDNKGHQSYWYAYPPDDSQTGGGGSSSGSKGTQSYWPAFRADDENTGGNKGNQSYWGPYAAEEQSQEKGNQSYWDFDDRI